MPPKSTKAAAPRKDKEQQKEKEVEVVAAAPSATIMGPIAAKATTGFSYKAMLTKNPPVTQTQEAAPAAAAAPAPVAKPAAPPQLVDLPGSEKKDSVAEEPKKATKKGGKAKKEAAVAAAEPAAEVAPLEAAAVEPAVEESEPPQVVIEVATPVVQPPASPEKIVADDEVAIPREAPQVSHEEKEQESKHFSWAEADPGYSAFSNNHFFTEAPAAAAPLPSVVEALTAPASLVTFRNGSASRRYHFVAPTNDKVVTSLMAILQTREDQATLREEAVKKREEELQKREITLEASIRKYNDDHARIAAERTSLAAERELLKQQQQQHQQMIAQHQQQQQQHQAQPAIPQVSQGHHSAHHPQMSSMPPRDQGVHPASYGRPHHMGGQHQQPMNEMNWAAEDEMYMQGYEYAHQPMYQQVPRGYGRPGGVSHQHAPRPNYNTNRMNMPGQMGGYPQQQGYTQPRMPRAAPMVNYEQYPPQQQAWRGDGY